MDIFEAIGRRVSVRHFSGRPLDPAIIERIIAAGTAAPSACNRQAWRFIVVTDQAVKDCLHRSGGSPFIPGAPAGVLVLYHRFSANLEYPDNIESAAACVQNMALAATALGVGSCWINHLPSRKIVRRLFSIPRCYDIIAYLALGYPQKVTEPMPRKHLQLSDVLSYNTFGEARPAEVRDPGRLAIWCMLRFLKCYARLPVLLKRPLQPAVKKMVRTYFDPDHSF